MRPVRRNSSPQADDFDDYADAKPELMSRLGRYCSYCERPINTNLAVEHIQPKKGGHAHSHLIGRWENFLLACVNCNSTKGDKNVVLADVMLPDRDNTFAVYRYTEDGKVTVAPGLASSTAMVASATLALVGLDKRLNAILDSNGSLVAIDRVAQRMEAWLTALEAKEEVDRQPESLALRRMAVLTASATGFFSIWMTVFHQDVDMRNRFIDTFRGTRPSGCFDPDSSAPVTPAPNPDGLADGGKA